MVDHRPLSRDFSPIEVCALFKYSDLLEGVLKGRDGRVPIEKEAIPVFSWIPKRQAAGGDGFDGCKSKHAPAPALQEVLALQQ
jgi:hypothetical protein